jgi:glycosyltransferase involved in cell wall biosynthesis
VTRGSRKRVLIVTDAGDAWPSGYVRALIYKDLFESDGIECEYVSRYAPSLVRLIEKTTLRFVEKPGRSASRLFGIGLSSLFARLNTLFVRVQESAIIRKSQSGYDAIYLQKTGSWQFVSALRRATAARLVYDLNDGVWLPSRAGFAGGRVRDILRGVDAITCDNPYGLDFARTYSTNLYLVPDPPQVELYDKTRSLFPKSGSSVILGWIGSPATAFNLFAIWEPLEVLFARFENITLRLVGTGYNPFLFPRFENVRFTTLPFYSQAQMIREVLQMDIGLFPLFDIEDSRVRGILKATVYMSGEVCVVASPIGQNSDLIQNGKNGVLARDAKEWLESMSALVTDTALRRLLAHNGLETVRGKFTIRQCYEKLRGALLAG